jgi:hypothetical protein
MSVWIQIEFHSTNVIKYGACSTHLTPKGCLLHHFAQIVSKKLGLGNLLTSHDITNWFH